MTRFNGLWCAVCRFHTCRCEHEASPDYAWQSPAHADLEAADRELHSPLTAEEKDLDLLPGPWQEAQGWPE